MTRAGTSATGRVQFKASDNDEDADDMLPHMPPNSHINSDGGDAAAGPSLTSSPDPEVPLNHHQYTAAAAPVRGILKVGISGSGAPSGLLLAEVLEHPPYPPLATKAIVFSQFWPHLSLIGSHLASHGVRFALLKRDLKPSDKSFAIATFRSDPQVERISEAGGLRVRVRLI